MGTDLRAKVVAALAASALLTVSACSLGSDEPHNGASSQEARSAHSTTVELKARGDTTATVDNIRLTLPQGAVPGDADAVTVSTGTVSPPTQLSDLAILSPAVHVSYSGPLNAPATLTFPGGSTDAGLQPVLVWQDDQGGFELTPTTWSEDKLRIEATVSHFSFGWLAGIDPKAIAGSMAHKLGAFVTGRAGRPNPTCGAPTEGVKVKSSGGDSVKWCAGAEDGAELLRITNNRTTFTEINYPKTWTVVNGTSVSFSTDTLARAIGMAYAAGSGRASRILDGGDTLTLRIPDGSSGTVIADMSVMSWLMSGVVNAVQTVSAVAEKVGVAGKGAAVLSHSKLSNIFLGTRDTDITSAMRTCVQAISDQTDEPLDENTFLSLGKLSLTCGAKVASVLLKKGQGAVTAGLISAIVDAAMIAIDLGNFAASALRYLWDEVASFGGKSDPQYRISVRFPLVGASLLGTTWYVHGGSLTINDDGSAQSMGHGACPDLDSLNWCNDVLDMTGVPTASGMTLTVTASYIHDEQTGETFPAAEWATPVGSVYTLQPYHDDYLITQLYSPTGEHLYPDQANGLGNPYLCEPDTSDPEQLCGA